MFARVTGKVVLAKQRTLGAAGQFKFTEVTIQTGVASMTTVRFTDAWEGLPPRAGDVLDIEVSLSGFAGRSGVEVNAQAERPFDETYVLELFTAAAA